MKRVSVIGLGYIGLPTAIITAEKGFHVLGYDIDKEKVKKISLGDPNIIEPEISTRLERVLEKRTFIPGTTLEKADYFVVAVPTPFKYDSKKAELSYVYSAAKAIAKVLEPGNLVILESTVSVGSTSKFITLLQSESKLFCSKDFFVAYCPERVLPGRIFSEIVSNDRVIGGSCLESSERAKAFYKKFVNGRMHVTNSKTAEMIKLVENSSRDVQIAFANQVASMCKEASINPFEVIDIANKHPRVDILQPGAGVGGHCVAVDPWFLVEGFKTSNLLKTARKINDAKPAEVVKEVLKEAIEFKDKHKEKPNVLALGLTFKPNVDDMRNSPALEIVQKLRKLSKINLHIYEPHVSANKLEELGFDDNVTFDAIFNLADIILILVPHRAFQLLKTRNLSEKKIIDVCGLLYESTQPQEPITFGAARLTQDDMPSSDNISDIMLVQ